MVASVRTSAMLRIVAPFFLKYIGVGDPLDAEGDLVGVLVETKKVGFLDLHLDATLALGDLQMPQGQQDRGRALRTALEADATAHGFRLIAKKAANTCRRRR